MVFRGIEFDRESDIEALCGDLQRSLQHFRPSGHVHVKEELGEKTSGAPAGGGRGVAGGVAGGWQREF